MLFVIHYIRITITARFANWKSFSCPLAACMCVGGVWMAQGCILLRCCRDAGREERMVAEVNFLSIIYNDKVNKAML